VPSPSADPAAVGPTTPTDAPELVVGLVAAPGSPADLAGSLSDDLLAELRRLLPGISWQIRPVVDGLVRPPADDDDLVDAARARLLAEDWDLAVCLTDLPLEVNRRPVVAHASPLHGVAVLSLPALGPVNVRRRALHTVTGLVRRLLGDADDDATQLVRRARALVTDPDAAHEGVQFTARVLSGNLRLLAGMVAANRPWRLAARLSRALTAAIAAGVFALVTPDIWQLADAFGWVRMTVVAVGSVVGTCATLVIGAGLWERAANHRVRKQVALFNLATTATVAIGVVSLYAALFVLSLGGSLLLVVPDVFAAGLGHDPGWSDYLELAWLISSLATVGGALGAGLESDDAVREAAYTYRPDVPVE
jgi:hypothetical protein